MSESFDVFLSHNNKDKPAVRELGLTLRARGLRVWLDEWELLPGRPWLDALERVIKTIGCAVVVVGRDGLGPWQDQEMRACLSEFVRRGVPVIPVLLPGAPDQPALPLLLRQFTWVDLRSGPTDEGVEMRVVRSGGWIGRAVVPRAAERLGVLTDIHGAFGFRVAAMPPSTLKP